MNFSRLAQFVLVLLVAGTAAAQSRSDSAQSYIERGLSWFEKGEVERAIADYDLAIVFNPGSVSAWYNRALSDLNRALELEPSLADAFAHRGVIQAERQEYTRAIADFDQALKLNPHLAATWGNRGLALLMQGRTDEAERDLVRCQQLGGKINPSVRELLRRMRGKARQ